MFVIELSPVVHDILLLQKILSEWESFVHLVFAIIKVGTFWGGILKNWVYITSVI